MLGNYSSDEEKTLSPKQLLLIAALVAGNPIVVAAKAAGVSEKTAHTWLKLVHVKVAYQQAKQELFNEQLDALRADVHLAIETLKRNMTESKPYVQVAAASKFLDAAVELHKMSEVEMKYLEWEERGRMQ
jgi:hypothetical protein